MQLVKKIGLIAIVPSILAINGCKKEDDAAKKDVPHHAHEVEVITDVKLIFTNTADSTDKVEAKAKDPDGAGAKELEILDEITLDTGKTYDLTYQIMNNSETSGVDIGKEILEAADEHQLFFSFTNDAFMDPKGDGNIDNAADAINYNDKDSKGYALGLSTKWTTGADALTGGKFVVKLQHQPDIKTGSTGASDGDTDMELEFVLNIKK